MPKGRFYVIEGIDGAGSETQSKLLVRELESRGSQCLFLDYPDYSKPIGNFINSYLQGNEHLPAEAKMLLYAADFLKDREAIEKALGEGRDVVACRYVTSALAYQVVEGVGEQKALDFVRLMGFPVPDLAILLKISAETSKKRKIKEKGELDRHESNLQFLAKVGARYEEMAKANVFCTWESINGEQGIDKIAAQIKKLLGL
jgi:dTMP kinase